MMLNKTIAAANRGPLDATYAADRGKGAATPEEARKLTANVKERFQEIGIQWLELGGMVRACLDRRVPEVLGITTLDWMKLCFDKSVPKIYRSLRIVSALDGVPLETLKEISEATRTSYRACQRKSASPAHGSAWPRTRPMRPSRQWWTRP